VPSRNIHLVGSVPLANACDVFTTVSAALGPRLLRIPVARPPSAATGSRTSSRYSQIIRNLRNRMRSFACTRLRRRARATGSNPARR
jgi:hypothetical protein